MTERTDVDKKVALGKALEGGMISMLDSDRPQNRLLGALRAVGSFEECGQDKDIRGQIIRRVTILAAKANGWTQEQIDETIEEGKTIRRLTESGQE